MERNEALDTAEELIISGKGGMIFTPNPAMIEYARKDKEFFRILNSASLSLCDGIGVSLASFFLGKGIIKRICGVDFGEALAKVCAEKGYSLYLLGGEEGVADKAAKNLISKYSGLRIAGTHDGYFENEWDVISEISLSGAEVLYVCLGSPKQERFIYYNRKYLPEVLMIGLGGSIDIYSENKRRAPVFLRKLGLEWVYRIIKEPKRLKKARVISFTLSVIFSRFGIKKRQKFERKLVKKV
jgi:N-acetylglucosaminyldiphosphoundecaprenol N-acetyl-beta-D-mannosaminyltransferase